MNEILKAAQDMLPQMIEDRRTIHRMGGVGFELRQSADYILSELEKAGIEAREVCPCGIVATVGRGDKTILLRADFDALPLCEVTGLPFANTAGSCHACGHDFHATMLLAAARMLKARENELNGVVKLVFQPAEETLEGSMALIRAGVLENPHVDAAFAMHVEAGAEYSAAGTVRYSRGATYAAGDKVCITVRGRGGHGALPSKNIDPVTASAQIIVAIQHIIAMEVPTSERVTVTFGMIGGGTADNIIPDEVVFRGTIRTFSNEMRAFVKRRVQEVAELTGRAMRCGVEVAYSEVSVPPVINNREMAERFFPYIEAVTGPGGTTLVDEPSSFGSEDFAHITERVPGLMINLGAGAVPQGYDKAMHNPALVLDENALPYGAAIFVSCAENWLKEQK